MALDTYDDLIAEGQDWLFGRNDLAAKFPTFILMFEAKANRKLSVRQMEQRSSAVVNMSAPEPNYIELPADFQSMRRIRIIGGTGGLPSLRYAPPVLIDGYRDEDDNPRQPDKFTIVGDYIELYPRPDQAYTLAMTYRQNIPALGTGNESNWLLATAPDLYLYGALMEAAPYLHEDERTPVWQSKLAEGFEDLHKMSDEALYNAGPLTIRRRSRY
jgi:hypothetical protein